MRVEILDPRLTRPIDLFEVAEELEGDSIMAVERRGKYLVLRLESGLSLLVHLRMTGSFGFEPTSHERAVLELDDGTRVGYRDVRRFGTWLVLEDAELEPYLAGEERAGAARRAVHLGVAGRATRRAQGAGESRCSSISASSPASGTSTPTRRSGELASIRFVRRRASTADETRRLHRAIRAALRAGIERQGSTLSEYRTPEGSRGGMQEEFRVYGRDGLPCRRCGTTIAKTRAGGRGTWYCPRCQPLG